MPIVVGYYIELVLLSLSCLLLWPLCLSQLLVMRFSSSSTLDRTKCRMLHTVGPALLCQTIRCVNPSGVFDTLDTWSFHLFQQEVTCIVLMAAVILSQSVAISLFQLLAREKPSWIDPLIWAGAGVYQIETIIYLFIEAILIYGRSESLSSNGLKLNNQIRVLIFILTMIYQFVVWLILFLRLYPPLKAALDVLELKELARLAEQQRLLDEAAEQRKEQEKQKRATPPRVHTKLVKVNARVHPLDSPVTDSVPAPLATPDSMFALFDPIDVRISRNRFGIEARQSPSDSPTGNAPENSNQIQFGGPRTSSHDNHAQQKYAVDVNAAGHGDAAEAVEPQTSDRDPGASTAPHGSTLLVVASAALLSGPSSRLLDLRSACWRFRLVMCIMGVTTLASGGSGVSLMTGSDEQVVSPDSYQPARVFSPLMQQVAIAAIIWYAWMPTHVWRNRHIREARSTPFWRTLINGVPTDSGMSATRNTTSPSKLESVTSADDGQQPALPGVGVGVGPAALDGGVVGGGVVLVGSTPVPVVYLRGAGGATHVIVESAGPIDSQASHAPTGLSMRSGYESIQARRGIELLSEADPHTHLHPFAIQDIEESNDLFEHSALQ